ncbi:putative phosphate transport system permease protein PstA [Octadecabacter arcticus 238]|jgi:phosphate transport system permease protein|uniref:Phosphate transport system permease protein PstA n=1 Tax=Octadecabacter arcticus 238 TaxID=391616 RepID=M9RQI0_9RHOB|nr:phosphate ABC transporter permease PstA [Octadecabacter arcticus]AGI72045.1 putative phosphate transport system permease protein PstA [Octadecabacter arcticus 238]
MSASKHGSLLQTDTHTKKRNAAEKRFRMYGLSAIGIALIALVILLVSIIGNGASSFRQTYLSFPVTINAAEIEAAESALLKTAAYNKIIQTSLLTYLTENDLLQDIPEADAFGMISDEAGATFRRFILADPEAAGTTFQLNLLANGRIDGYFKGRVTAQTALLDQNVTPAQLVLADRLADQGALVKRFNWAFFTNPDASDQRPEAAGLGVAILGSLYMMAVVLCLALPIGVAASIYLEEFARKSWITDVIEVNIANLAAVPSIVYGILGLAIFINFAELNQSSPLVGGLVLTLMTLPTIIISTRASLKSIPPSIRDAALGVGASKMQSVFHHVLPLAAPGILTGTIIGLAQALGETAPLLLIGMVAFVKEYPAAWSPDAGLFGEASTALPVQVFNWTQRSDPAFVERASGAIITLLIFLLIMNALAIFLRKKFERRW